MGHVHKELTRDVKILLRRTLVCESSERIWNRFEEAMSSLDGSALVVLRHHFSGSSTTEIAKRLLMTEREARTLVHTAKRQLTNSLRKFCKVRQ